MTLEISRKSLTFLYYDYSSQEYVACSFSSAILKKDSTVFKALCYKSEGGCFDPSWCHWNFLLT